LCQWFSAHWAMSCGNDEIIGAAENSSTTVPAPGATILLGIGLAGLGVVAARRRGLRKMSVSSPRLAGMEIMGYNITGLPVSFLRKRCWQ